MCKDTSKNKHIQNYLDHREKRLTELEKEIKNAPEYQTYSEEEEKLFQEIKQILTDPIRELLIKYLEVLEKIAKFESSYFYDNGFVDCAELFKSISENELNKSK